MSELKPCPWCGSCDLDYNEAERIFVASLLADEIEYKQ